MIWQLRTMSNWSAVWAKIWAKIWNVVFRIFPRTDHSLKCLWEAYDRLYSGVPLIFISHACPALGCWTQLQWESWVKTWVRLWYPNHSILQGLKLSAAQLEIMAQYSRTWRFSCHERLKVWRGLLVKTWQELWVFTENCKKEKIYGQVRRKQMQESGQLNLRLSFCLCLHFCRLL